MTNVFVLVQGQHNRDQLQQVVSQLEVHEQQVASQLEVHEQQVASQLEVHEQQVASQLEVHEQQVASQLEVNEQQVASQLEVLGQQLKEDMTTQEKAKETKMTGMVYTPAFPLGRYYVEREITFLWLGPDLRVWGLGI